MKLSYEDHNTIAVVTISGSLTNDQVDSFRRACLDRFEKGVKDIVLNVEHLTSVDSAGLELLLWVIDEAGDHGGRLKLVRPEETIRKILQVTRLEQRFDVHESIEAAAKSLR